VAVTADATHVYMSDTTGGRIWRVGHDGSDPTAFDIASTGPWSVYTYSGASSVFWTGNTTMGVAAVFEKAKTAGTGDPPNLVWTGTQPLVQASHVTANNSHTALCWTHSLETMGTAFYATLNGSVVGQPIPLVSNDQRPQGIACSDTNEIFWTHKGSDVVPADGAIRHWNPGLGTPVDEADVQQHPRGIAIQGAYVYWVTYGRTMDNDVPDGTVMRQRWSPPGGTPEIIATDQGEPAGIVVDSTHVYWTTSSQESPEEGLLQSRVHDGSELAVVLAGSGSGDVGFGIFDDHDDVLFWPAVSYVGNGTQIYKRHKDAGPR
jgi:sugar lactone lactonase YvrE